MHKNQENNNSFQIQKIQSENVTFKKELDSYMKGEMLTNKVINVCSTPNVMKILGSNARKVVLNQSCLRNAISLSEDGVKNHTEGHKIEISVLRNLPDKLRNPFMIIKGSEKNINSIVCITEIKNIKNENIIVPIALDRQNGNVNIISTIFGKKNIYDYIDKNKEKIMALNIEKAEVLSRNFGVQFPKSLAESSICYDDSIVYTMENVKYPKEKED